MNHPGTAVLIGRFQPPHHGHLTLMLWALERHDRLLVLLGSANLARSARDPFGPRERAALLRAALMERGVAPRRVSIRALPDRFDSPAWAADVREAVSRGERHVRPGATATLVGHGRDESSAYLHWFPEWPLELVEEQRSVSATEVRAALFSADWPRVAARVPAPVLTWLRSFAGSRTFARLAAEHAEILRERSALVGVPLPLCEWRWLYVREGAVWLERRKAVIGRGLWCLPGGRVGGGPERLSPSGGWVFDHPRRALLAPTVAWVWQVEAPRGGEPVPLGLALRRPRRFFEDHGVMLARLLADRLER